MTRRTRYLLIGLCIAAFAVLAPLIIFYIRGITYDTGDNRYLKTGILSIESEPKSAEIILDDKSVDTTPSDIRFLKPGGYNVKVQKPGFHTWEKRLEILPNKVTWANPEGGKIFLFLKEPISQPIAENVTDFYKLDSGWIYLSGKNLIISSDDLGTILETIPLLKPGNTLLASKDESNFLIFGEKSFQIFKKSTKKITDVSPLLKNSANFDWDNQGSLWAREANNLVKISAVNSTKSVVVNNVSAFKVSDDKLYYLQKSSDNKSFSLFSSDYNNSRASITKITGNLALINDGKLVVTSQKKVFFLSQQTLYRINTGAEKIAENVTDLNYDPFTDTLSFSSKSELNFYNFATNQVQLINRSGSGFSNSVIRTEVGISLYAQEGRLLVAELDTRDHQNIYPLTGQVKTLKFQVDNLAKKVYLLSEGKLQILTIR